MRKILAAFLLIFLVAASGFAGGVQFQTIYPIQNVLEQLVFEKGLRIFAGQYINFGLTSGSGGYGVRDNPSSPGTIQYKDSGGSWIALNAIGASHAMLSATHSDSTAAAVTRGALITGQGSTPKWTAMTLGTVGKVPISDGADLVWSTALGSAAYTASTAYDVAGAAAAVTPTTLSLVIGTNTQAYSTKLAGLSNLADAAGWYHSNGSGTYAWSTPSKSDVGLSSVENTALSTWTGSTYIASTGTVTAGRWDSQTQGLPVDYSTTTDLTAVSGACYGQSYGNTGAGASTTVTLPAAVAGMRFSYEVVAAQTIVLTPHTGDQFDVVTSAANKTLTSDAVAGTFIYFECRTAGHWRMKGMNGSWTSS